MKVSTILPLALLLASCGAGTDKKQSQLQGDGGAEPSPDGAQGVDPLVFQPAFHQALRQSESLGTTTLRLRVPLGRAGERVRFTFRAGDGVLELLRANVARVGTDGLLGSTPIALAFGGAPGFSAQLRQRVTSDPVKLPVAFREELFVTFVVQGAVAKSAIELFAGGSRGAGDQADASGPFGEPQLAAIGLATAEVEAAGSRVAIALGDSMTEGYVEGKDEYLESWPAVAEARLGTPVLNAGVSGQGVDGELENLAGEVLALQGLTDCVVLLGTNDLGGTSVERIERNLDLLYDKLRPHCRVWAGTLPPKENAQVYADRLALNAWIRAHPQVDGVVDFEAVLADPANVHRYAEGLGMDGIHPSVEGQKAMGLETARGLGGDPAAQ